MVAPPNQEGRRTSSPLETAAAAASNSSASSQQAHRLNPGDGPRWRGDSENTRPAGWTDNPATAAATAGPGAGGRAGRGSVSGILSSTSTPAGRGPEVDDDHHLSRRVAGSGAPLADRQEQQQQQQQPPILRSAAAAARAMNSANEVVRGQQSSSRSGVIRGFGGDSKRAADVEMEMWKLGLQIGSKLDVKDTVDRWCEATVAAVDREAARVFVTYTYWAPKWDEWISIDSPCLAPAGTMTYQEGGPLHVGHRVEVLDEIDQHSFLDSKFPQCWLEADVMKEAEDGRALVHFKGYSEKFDLWVSPHGGRVRQHGPYRVAPTGATRSSARQASLAPGQQHVRQIAQLSRRRYEHYERALRNQGLRVVPVEGDGNCLFRSVSHQVYGDDSHHRLVRARCMEYMESEAHFFEPYVEGDMAAFLRYLDVKRQNAVWGDDPEVQALCEIYDRPAEIWAYDPQLGAKTLRSFHETAGIASSESPRPPMRLSYYGGGHYDSVAPIDSPASSGMISSPLGGGVTAGAGAGAGAAEGAAAFSGGGAAAEAATSGGLGTAATGAAGAAGAAGAPVPIPEPGQLEDAALERSRRRAAEAGSGRWDFAEMKVTNDDDNSPAGRAAMDYALAFSRNEFEAQFNDLDSALVASVDHMEKSNLSSLEAASRDSELVVLQEEMLRSAQAQSEEEQLRNALEASRNTAAAAAAEADLVRQAIAESMGSGAGVGVVAGDGGGAVVHGSSVGGASESAADGSATAKPPGAAVASEEQGQQQQTLGSTAAATAAGAVDGGEEEEELKKALLMSGMATGADAWQTLPAEAGGPAKGFDLDDDDAQLRLAIEASLAGE
ncbi:unnamed protein product [Pylaiella littoralis]